MAPVGLRPHKAGRIARCRRDGHARGWRRQYAAVAVTEVRRQLPETMDQAPQAVPAAERFYGGPVAVYAARVKIEPIRDLPRFGGTGGWIMMCPG